MRRFLTCFTVLIGLVLTSCATTKTEEIKPGTGMRFTVTGLTYDQVWGAATRAILRNYAILKQDQTRGMITVERTLERHFWREQVVVFIMPANIAAETYTVEVAIPPYMMTKMSTTNFQAVVVEDIKAELDMISDKEGYKKKLGV